MEEELLAKLRAHVDAHGLRPTAQLLGLHQETLLRFPGARACS